MEDERPFFTKSREKFNTGTIEAWGMLRKHYAALTELSRRNASNTTYCKLWYYEKRLEKMIKELEQKPALLIIQDEEITLPLDTSAPCQPIKYEGPCTMTKTTEEETVGTYLRSMRQSSQAASSSGE